MLEKIKSIFQPGKQENMQKQVDELINGFEYFGMKRKLAKNIFNQKPLKTHEEKYRCKKAYNDNSYIQTGVNYLLNVVLGENPCIDSHSNILKKYAKKWGKYSNATKAIKQALRQAIITGDGYVKKIRGNKGSIKYKNIQQSEDMYIDMDYETGRVKRYIQRVYYSQAKEKDIDIKTFKIRTPHGREHIKGVEYAPSKIKHFQFQEGNWSIYGRSPIASVLNDIMVLDRMERSLAVISMNKAIPKKLIMPSDDNMNTQQIKKVINTLKKAKDFEDPVIGKKMTSIDITGTNSINLQPYLDYFKRKISSCLSPEFIIHGELVNRNTSVEQKQLFYLAVGQIRDEFIDDINEMINEGLNANLNALEDKIDIPRDEFWYSFGEYDIELREEKNKRILNEWQTGLIKLNEYREQMGYEQDEALGDFYKYELTGTAGQEQQALEELKKAMDIDEKEQIPQDKSEE